jgi:hypothetical protein
MVAVLPEAAPIRVATTVEAVAVTTTLARTTREFLV